MPHAMTILYLSSMEQNQLQVLLAKYKESHQHPTNQKIHWVCVPLIFYSLVGLLHAIPVGSISVAWVAMGLVWLYYVRLSVKLSLGFLIVAVLCLALAHGLQQWGNKTLIFSSLAIFALAWVGQFYGHKVEGKKPSFLTDVQFLLIGPAWILQYIYQAVGIKLYT